MEKFICSLNILLEIVIRKKLWFYVRDQIKEK